MFSSRIQFILQLAQEMLLKHYRKVYDNTLPAVPAVMIVKIFQSSQALISFFLIHSSMCTVILFGYLAIFCTGLSHYLFFFFCGLGKITVGRGRSNSCEGFYLLGKRIELVPPSQMVLTQRGWQRKEQSIQSLSDLSAEVAYKGCVCYVYSLGSRFLSRCNQKGITSLPQNNDLVSILLKGALIQLSLCG